MSNTNTKDAAHPPRVWVQFKRWSETLTVGIAPETKDPKNLVQYISLEEHTALTSAMEEERDRYKKALEWYASLDKKAKWQCIYENGSMARVFDLHEVAETVLAGKPCEEFERWSKHREALAHGAGVDNE